MCFSKCTFQLKSHFFSDCLKKKLIKLLVSLVFSFTFAIYSLKIVTTSRDFQASIMAAHRLCFLRALLIPWSLFSRHNAESPTSFCHPRLDMLLFSHVFLFRTGHNPPWMQRDTALPHVDNACQWLHLGPSAHYFETSDWNWLSSAPSCLLIFPLEFPPATFGPLD